MGQPIGYFCNYTPGDGGLLGDMEESWGSQFQNLNNQQRLWMAFKLAEDLCAEEGEVSDNGFDDEVENAMDRMDELSARDKLGLIECLVNQVKSSSQAKRR